MQDELLGWGRPLLPVPHYSAGTSTIPTLPSTVTTWPSLSRAVASPVPTTAGIPNSRATSEACASTLPVMIRLFVAPLGTKEQIVSTLEQVRAEAREMLRFGREVKQEFLDGISVTQDQVYIRALAVDFFISLLNTVHAWAERTLEEIEDWDDLSPDGKNQRGMEIMRQVPVDTPGESLKDVSIPPRGQMRSRSS